MNIRQLTTKLSNNILSPSQLSNTKGRGKGIHSNGSPGKNGRGNAKGHSQVMANDKCPPPFEIDDLSNIEVIFL